MEDVGLSHGVIKQLNKLNLWHLQCIMVLEWLSTAIFQKLFKDLFLSWIVFVEMLLVLLTYANFLALFQGGQKYDLKIFVS